MLASERRKCILEHVAERQTADELTMTGPLAEATLQRFYADVCILGAAGSDPVVGVTEIDYESAALHRLMIERSRRVILLADQSKLGFRAPAVVTPTSLVSTLITDESAPEEMLAQLRACGMETVRLEKDKVKKGIHSVEEEAAV